MAGVSAGRLWGANWLDRLVASDPGLNRLTSAARAVGGVATALGVEYVVALLTGQPALVPMMLGAVVAMMAAFGVSDATRGGQAVTLLSLPLFMFAGMGLAIAVDRFRLASLLVFVVVMFAAVFIRRFGPRYFIGGMIAFMGYFFALFLGLTLPALPAVVLAVLVAVAWSMVLSLVLFPVHNDRVLRRMLHAFEARARAVGDAAAGLLAAPDSGGERAVRALARLHGRSVQVNEAALIIDGQLGTPGAVVDDAAADATRHALFDGELAAAEIAETVRLLVASGTVLPAAVAEQVGGLLDAVRSGAWSAVEERAIRLEAGARQVVGTIAMPLTTDGTPAAGADTMPVEASHVVRRMAEAASGLARAWRDWTAVVAPGAGRSAVVAPRSGRTDEEGGFTPAVQLFAGNMPGSAITVGAMIEGSAGGYWSRLSLTTRQAVQVAVATGLSIAAGDALSGQRYYWAVLAAFIAFTGTATSAETVAKALNRILGTMLGLVGAIPLVALTGSSTAAALPVILISIFLGFYLLRVSYAVMIFFITLLVGELYAVLGTFTPELMVLRLEETAIGGVIGCVVCLLVLPIRTRAAATAARKALLDNLRTLLERLEEHLRDPRTPIDLPGAARVLDAQLHQVLLISRPLTPSALPAAGAARRRRMMIYTGLAHHARRVAQLADAVGHLDDAWRARLGAAVTGIAELVDALAQDQPRPDPMPIAATADRLAALDVADHPARPLVHELTRLHGTLVTLAGAPGVGVPTRPSVSEPAREPAVHGRVQRSTGRPAEATLALVDMRGRQHDGTTTDADGCYRLTAPEPGYYLLICTPAGASGLAGGAAPHANWVSVDARPSRHDIVLPSREPESLGDGRKGQLVGSRSTPRADRRRP
jgi:hypothetical protein